MNRAIPGHARNDTTFTCQCGKYMPVSAAYWTREHFQAWHRQHKADVLAGRV